MDSFSRFDQDPLETAHPKLPAKLLRAAKITRAVPLIKAEADYLIADNGGPDPDYEVPQQLVCFRTHALVVQSGNKPKCWRL